MVPDASELTTLFEYGEVEVLALVGDPIREIDAEEAGTYVDNPNLTIGWQDICQHE